MTQRIREIGYGGRSGRRAGRFSGSFDRGGRHDGVGGVIGISAGILFGFAIARFAGWKMVFSLQAIVIAVTVSAAWGFSFLTARVAPRRSIRSRHCGMN